MRTTPKKTDIPAAIRRELNRADMSASELASRAGISRQYLSDLLAGRRTMTAAMIVRLYAALPGSPTPPGDLLLASAGRGRD